MVCMTFLEDVLAGLVVAVLSWAMHRLRTWWTLKRPMRYPSQKSEPFLMGKHGDLTQPVLPIGPRRDLVELLRGLHGEAGLSLRAVGQEAGLSAATVQKVLIGGRTSKASTMSVGNALMLRAVQTRTHLNRAEQDQTLIDLDRQISALYKKAIEEDAGPHPVEVAACRLWDEIAQRACWNVHERLSHDVWGAIEKSDLTFARFYPVKRTVAVMVNVPDDESFRALKAGYYRGEPSWTDEFERALSYKVDMLVRVELFLTWNYDEEAEAES